MVIGESRGDMEVLKGMGVSSDGSKMWYGGCEGDECLVSKDGDGSDEGMGVW